MKKYLILSQHPHEERDFVVQDIETGKEFTLDFYTGGEIEVPAGVDATEKTWRAWLNTFVGKTLEIEDISPYKYFTHGKINVIEQTLKKEVYSERI